MARTFDALSQPATGRRLTRWAGTVGLLVGLIGAACSSPERTNVVLISIDTLRPDRLGCYGGPRPTSPTIDALAARGVRFENAFTTSPWTLPAHASMLTGHYPSSLAARGDGQQLYAATPQLSTLLQEQGYATGAVTGGGYVSENFGVQAGFDHFEVGEVQGALDWLNSVDKPFFLFFHTYRPHIPYSDRRFVGERQGERFSDIYLGPREDWWQQHLDACCGTLELSDEERDYFRALYDGGVAAADTMVQEILGQLEELGVAGKTLVILTSDHGEEFWEHTGRGAYHGHTLYDELARIPFIWVDPALEPASRVVEAPVSLVDIVPTVMARLGLAPPESTEGKDLAPLLDAGSWSLDRPIFSEFTRYGPPRKSVRTSQAKLIFTPDPSAQRLEAGLGPIPVLAAMELYLTGDVGELENVAESNPDLTETLVQLIERHELAAGEASFDGPAEVDAETLERLRSLGYVE